MHATSSIVINCHQLRIAHVQLTGCHITLCTVLCRGIGIRHTSLYLPLHISAAVDGGVSLSTNECECTGTWLQISHDDHMTKRLMNIYIQTKDNPALSETGSCPEEVRHKCQQQATMNFTESAKSVQLLVQIRACLSYLLWSRVSGWLISGLVTQCMYSALQMCNHKPSLSPTSSGQLWCDSLCTVIGHVINA